MLSVAVVALVVVAGLNALTGLALTLGLFVMSAFDPTLGGESSLAFTLGGFGLSVTAIAAITPLLGAQALWEGRGNAREIAGLVGLCLLPTPLFFVGGGLIYVAIGDAEVRDWLMDARQLRLD
ncbi:MAG: hypothetical protein AB8H79_21445, partial [Myxococcota bacterium]